MNEEGRWYLIKHSNNNKNNTIMWSYKFKSAFLTKQNKVQSSFCSQILKRKVIDYGMRGRANFKTLKEEFSLKNENQFYEYAIQQKEKLLHKIDMRLWSSRFTSLLKLDSESK